VSGSADYSNPRLLPSQSCGLHMTHHQLIAPNVGRLAPASRQAVSPCYNP